MPLPVWKPSGAHGSAALAEAGIVNGRIQIHELTPRAAVAIQNQDFKIEIIGASFAVKVGPHGLPGL